jgi:prepilin-type N-terminal cleavage/methylation domain-containing protein
MIPMTHTDGFTLIELLVVMGIITFVASIGVTQLQPDPETIITRELDRIATLCTYLQQRARASQQQHALMIDIPNNRYLMQIGNRLNCYTLSQSLLFGTPPQSGSPNNQNQKARQPVTFSQKNGLHCIDFFPNGKISSGSLYIIDKQESTGGALTCGVTQVSYIRRYVYKNHHWQALPG